MCAQRSVSASPWCTMQIQRQPRCKVTNQLVKLLFLKQKNPFLTRSVPASLTEPMILRKGWCSLEHTAGDKSHGCWELKSGPQQKQHIHSVTSPAHGLSHRWHGDTGSQKTCDPETRVKYVGSAGCRRLSAPAPVCPSSTVSCCALSRALEGWTSLIGQISQTLMDGCALPRTKLILNE